MARFCAAHVPDQSGRTILITGANTGLGLAIARVLAAKRARVLLGCRNEARAEAAMARIRAETPDADLAFVPLDQADLASVRAAAAHVVAEPRLDILINNAGIMVPPLGHTVDGFEQQFGVNHLGTFALTGLLLPKLAEAPAARVVITASIAHKRARIAWDDLTAAKSYDPFARYAQSKLANLLFLAELNRRLRAAGSPVRAIGCHPGVAVTEITRNLPGVAKLFWPLLSRLVPGADQGAEAALYAATAPDAAPGGYYGPTGFAEARGSVGAAQRSALARDPAAARRLWEVSVKLTGVDPQLGSANRPIGGPASGAPSGPTDGPTS